MSGPNIFDLVNQAIFDFVQEPGNRSLMAGTGAYSTPFRGELFGYSETSAVVKQLVTRRVEALWFGSNPNVPQSISQIIDPQHTKSDFRDFERQMNSGVFSHCLLDEEGHLRLAWNPIQEPTAIWSAYRDILEKVVNIDSVTMANFMPWGSANLDTLVATLGGFDSGLLQRAVRFADDLNREIVSSLQPGFVVVPFSLGRNRLSTGLSLVRAGDRKEYSIDLDGKPFNFSTGVCALGVRAVYLPSPSSLRLTAHAKAKLVEQVSLKLDLWIAGR